MRYLAVAAALALGGCGSLAGATPKTNEARIANDYLILDAKGEWKKNGVIFAARMSECPSNVVRRLYSEGKIDEVRLEHRIDTGQLIESSNYSGIDCRGLEERILYYRSLNFTAAQTLAFAYDQRRSPETRAELERGLSDTGIVLSEDYFGRNWDRAFCIIKAEASRVIIGQRTAHFAQNLRLRTAYVVDLLVAQILFDGHTGPAVIIAPRESAEWDLRIRQLYEHMRGQHR